MHRRTFISMLALLPFLKLSSFSRDSGRVLFWQQRFIFEKDLPLQQIDKYLYVYNGNKEIEGYLCTHGPALHYSGPGLYNVARYYDQNGMRLIPTDGDVPDFGELLKRHNADILFIQDEDYKKYLPGLQDFTVIVDRGHPEIMLPDRTRLTKVDDPGEKIIVEYDTRLRPNVKAVFYNETFSLPRW